MSINDNMARVNVAGIVKTASLQLVDNARVGDYIILHAGFAIQLLDEDEALETLKIWEFIDDQTFLFLRPTAALDHLYTTGS